MRVWVYVCVSGRERESGLCQWGPSAPAERHVSGAVASLLYQWLVKFSAGPRVDAGPAVLAVVLQAGDVGTEEGRKLAAAACALALVTHLVVQHVRLNLHLQGRPREKNKEREKKRKDVGFKNKTCNHFGIFTQLNGVQTDFFSISDFERCQTLASSVIIFGLLMPWIVTKECKTRNSLTGIRRVQCWLGLDNAGEGAAMQLSI